MAIETKTVQYKSAEAADRGTADMLASGWAVQNRETVQPKAGCMRWIATGGIGAIIIKPKLRTHVTFTRETDVE